MSAENLQEVGQEISVFWESVKIFAPLVGGFMAIYAAYLKLGAFIEKRGGSPKHDLTLPEEPRFLIMKAQPPKPGQRRK